MKMVWNALKFFYEAWFNENQRIKYLNKERKQKWIVFRSLPRGVFRRLSSLINFSKSNRRKTVDQSYPKNSESLIPNRSRHVKKK